MTSRRGARIKSMKMTEPFDSSSTFDFRSIGRVSIRIEVNVTDNCGQTTLHLAVYNSNVEVFQLLLAKTGISINVKNNL